MKTFMDEHAEPGSGPDIASREASVESPAAAATRQDGLADADVSELVCEEYLLEQFAGDGR